MTKSISFCVYQHTSPTGKSYIGQTSNYKARCIAHRSQPGCTAFYGAIKKYGWESFSHRIIMDGLTLDEANELEEFLIAEADTVSPRGYNLRSGGSNSSHSDETRAKMSIASKGIVHSPEARAKMSASRAGVPFSEEHRKNLAMTMIGNQRSLGYKYTPEQIKAKSEAMKGRKQDPEHTEKVAAQNRGRKRTEAHINACVIGRALTYERKATIYHISHTDGRIEVGNRKYLTSKCDMSPSCMGELTNGIRKAVKGWELIRKEVKT